MWTHRRTQILALAALLAFNAPVAHAFSFETLDFDGVTLVLPAPQAESLRIVINLPARRLALVEGETLVASWPVAVGKPSTPTPVGNFRILQMAKDPTWAPKGGPVVPPGPHNPLGTRWMRISADGYGIHATNDPRSIGHARSKGCIRMHVADAEDLYARVAVGIPVEIVYELQGWEDGRGPVSYPDLYATDPQTPP